MNFFESQDVAKRNTTRLIVLFLLAIICLIVITNVLVMVLFTFAETSSVAVNSANAHQFDWQTFLVVGAAVTVVVLFGSLYKISSLSGGGARVAEMMNGRLLVQGSDNLHEQRALNVVEEMAIASGTPVPPVYLLEESGINAFAAGFNTGDAVIGLTRGAVETLSRDQLQGVVAHEFSHILHGDMRINIRLIGVLYGILMLGIVGQYLLRGSMFSRRSRNAGGAVALGLGLMIIGFVGTFFGNLIKAAVSRQREYLADASAVQFTRNPQGIGGALMRIATHDKRSYLSHPGSQEISHALFEEGGHSALRSLFATHPPLEKRIEAILPDWDGSYELLDRPRPPETESNAKAAQRSGQEILSAILAGSASMVIGEGALSQAGTPDSGHLDYAGEMLAALPGVLRHAAQDPSGARAVIYLLVLSREEEVRARQLEQLRNSADRGVYLELQRLLDTISAIAPESRLTLVEIAQGSLRQLSESQYRAFRQNFQVLIRSDEKLSLSEWCLQQIVFHQLDVVFNLRKTPALGRRDLRQLREAAALLLATVAWCAPQDGISTEQAFERGQAHLDIELDMPERESLSLSRLGEAIEALHKLKPLQKPALLKAVAACISADKVVVPTEIEVFRAIAILLQCPMPPLRERAQ